MKILNERILKEAENIDFEVLYTELETIHDKQSGWKCVFKEKNIVI